MTSYDYYELRKNKIADRINYEKICITTQCSDIIDETDNYIAYLINRIGPDAYEAPKTMTIINRFNVREQIEKLDMAEHTKDLDRLSYQKPWVKLRDFHKVIKIKEFVAKLEYPGKLSESAIKKNREEILQKLLDGLKEKKIGKNKSEITYNEEEMQIEDIECLTMQKNKYYVDW